MFSAPASRVNSSMNNLYRNAQRMNRGTLQSIQAQNTAIAGIGVMAMRGMGSAIKIGAEYGDMMTYIGAISDKTGIKMGTLSDKALSLGKSTMFTSRDIASGMRFMAQAGMKRGEIESNIGAATNLAASTMSNLGGVGGSADVMTNIMRMFDKNQSQSDEVADILSVTTSSANLQLTHLGEAMKYAGTTMHSLKIPLSETSAMIGVMGDAGIQGSMAGTSLANMYRYLAKAMGQFGTKRQAEALNMLGLSKDSFMTDTGDLKERHVIFKELLTAAQNQTTVGGKTMMDALFGIRGEKSATLLINNLDKYKSLMDKISNGRGTAARITDEMMGSLKGNMNKMSSAYEVLQTRFTEAVTPILIPLLKVVTKITNALTSLFEIPVLGKFLGGFLMGFVAVKTVAAAFKIILSTIGLIHNKNTTAFAARTASTVAGYAKMTASARGYAAASRSGGFGAYGSKRAVMYNKGGNLVASGFGRRQRGSSLGTSAGSLGDRYKQRFGGRMGFGIAGGAGRKGIMGMLGRLGSGILGGGAMGGIMGRVLGFLGGPLGMAISVGIPLITSLVGALNSNTDSNTDSSEETKENRRQSGDALTRYVLQGRSTLSNMGYQGDSSTISAQRLSAKMEAIRVFGDNSGSKKPISIYFDGLEAKMEEVSENVMKYNLEGYNPG
jgi:TP901 family phage tail tape measure protein